ncbi:hypothetical protein EDB80DRAFT_817914 [Ilyonectria destructans]|nr:hypothetical protein EDB80DRAFT_817914 [Ilyonectria destructans]
MPRSALPRSPYGLSTKSFRHPNELLQGYHKSHGTCSGHTSQIWNLAADGSEIITEVGVREGTKTVNKIKKPFIHSIAFATSDCNVWDTAVKQREEDADATGETKPTDADTKAAAANLAAIKDIKSYTWTHPKDGRLSLRGFFSFKIVNEAGADMILCTVGVVWAKDVFIPLPECGVQFDLVAAKIRAGRVEENPGEPELSTRSNSSALMEMVANPPGRSTCQYSTP